MLRLASVGGRPCPGPSVQYDICSYPCDNFYWTVSAWSQCSSLFEQKSSPVGKCGRGRKTRTIRLVVIHHGCTVVGGLFFHSPKLRKRVFFVISKKKRTFDSGVWKRRRTALNWMFQAISVIPKKNQWLSVIAESIALVNVFIRNGQNGRAVTR